MNMRRPSASTNRHDFIGMLASAFVGAAVAKLAPEPDWTGDRTITAIALAKELPEEWVRQLYELMGTRNAQMFLGKPPGRVVLKGFSTMWTDEHRIEISLQFSTTFWGEAYRACDFGPLESYEV